MPTAPTPTNHRQTLTFDADVWARLCEARGLRNEAEQAAAIGVARSTLNRVRHRHAAPGPEFIAGVLSAFPRANVRTLFPVVAKDPIA